MSLTAAAVNIGGKYGRRLLARTRTGSRSLSKLWRKMSAHTRALATWSTQLIAPVLLPPYRCPGCAGWRTRRRLAECEGVIAQPLHRRRVFATGCPRCGLLFATPRPTGSQMRSWYSESGEWASTHAGSADAGPGRPVSSTLVTAVDAVAGIRTPPPGGGHVLDFGCGNGRWLDTMAGFGWETFGIDPALKTAFTRHTELAAIPAAAQFHFVIVSHVLEHVTNPGSLLKALAAATRPGGWIYFSVPDLDRLPEHGDWHYVLNARAQLAAYSVDCLTTLLSRADFGRAQVVRLPREEGHSGKRLRMVAQRSAPVAPVPDPLAAAIRALAGYQTAAATDGDGDGRRPHQLAAKQ